MLLLNVIPLSCASCLRLVFGATGMYVSDWLLFVVCLHSRTRLQCNHHYTYIHCVLHFQDGIDLMSAWQLLNGRYVTVKQSPTLVVKINQWNKRSLTVLVIDACMIQLAPGRWQHVCLLLKDRVACWSKGACFNFLMRTNAAKGSVDITLDLLKIQKGWCVLSVHLHNTVERV